MGLSLALTGCATSSASSVSDLIDAAREGDSAEILRHTSRNLSQDELAVVVSYALEGCLWESGTASAGLVQGTFTCPEDGRLGIQTFDFTLTGRRVSSIEKTSD